MGRKAYLEDLAIAKKLRIPNVSDIKSGEDGELTFAFRSADHTHAARITATVIDSSQYPASHDYYIFAADEASSDISNAVAAVPDLARKSVPQLLTTLSMYLMTSITHGGANGKGDRISGNGTRSEPLTFSSEPEAEADEWDPDNEEDNQDWVMGDDYEQVTFAGPAGAKSASRLRGIDPGRIRQDLISAKTAGFKVGALGSLQSNSSCYVSISCKIAKLGISEEAMQAWSVEPSEYLILLLYFPFGYRDMDSFNMLELNTVEQHVQFRTCVSNLYKPSSTEEAKSFFHPSKAQEKTQAASTLDAGQPSGIRETFISGPLNALLKERFPILLRFRVNRDFSWSRAERYYQENVGKHTRGSSEIDPGELEEDALRPGLPPIATADEVCLKAKESEMSLPLVTMQFMLRHFVNCVDFCQVCHCRIESSLEALKPYVCEKPLCLFQYMNLGFGPSIEQEILAQPLVVDLLVGFCYSAASCVRLRDLPALDWKVPHPNAIIYGRKAVQSYQHPDHQRSSAMTAPHDGGTPQTMTTSEVEFEARYCKEAGEMLTDQDPPCPVQKGDWIVINITTSTSSSCHCRVLDVSFLPSVFVSKPLEIESDTTSKTDTAMGIAQPAMASNENQKPRASTEARWVPIKYHKYQTSFQELNPTEKAKSMILMLDLLPKVTEMRDYLASRPGSKLLEWQDRMPPAALGLLRWIVASNRSAIIAVDEIPSNVKHYDNMQLGVRKSEERVPGLGEWLQFRFAMGSPDKETRFVSSLHNSNAAQPTLFAWHGSPIYNWHGIIREGLNYNETLHGRAYGHGCYHAKDWATSGGYAGMGSGGLSWPQSILRVNTAMALSEIVNAPEKYTSQNPHYVVQHVDWIQTRYLFAQPATNTKLKVTPDAGLTATLPQDPSRIPTGPQGVKIALPLSAVPKSRRPGFASNLNNAPQAGGSGKPAKKKAKLTQANLASTVDGSGGSLTNAVDVDALSMATLVEDLVILCDPDIVRPPPRPSFPPCTDFVPGATSDVPTMPPPKYATRNATTTLQKAFRSLLSAQEQHEQSDRLPELGWYADSDHLERTGNLYQWIVQLHSFPLELPLGQDMQAMGITSILLELRFSASFPFSPPFVRVVRPRFLPFQQGGGGHVTAGGSICMDLLTIDGWTAVASIESVLLQIRVAMMSTEPRPARLEGSRSSQNGKGKGRMIDGVGPYGGRAAEYGVSEAVEAFVRACRVHGWAVPTELTEMTAGGQQES